MTCMTTTWESCSNRPSPTSSICAKVAAGRSAASSFRRREVGAPQHAHVDEHQHVHLGHDHAQDDHAHSRQEHSPGHDDHGHSHGLVHDSIKRSREGVRAVLISLGVLGLAAVAQTLIFVLSGSVALLADLIHNFGDALTAVPLGIAFATKSLRGERWAGLVIVAVILTSAVIAGIESIQRLISPQHPTHLLALAFAGLVGVLG